MAVLLAKPQCSLETVNDLHGDLINLARVVKDERLGPQLYRRLRRAMVGKPFLEDARSKLLSEECGTTLNVDRAEVYFLNSWLGMNGIAGTLGGQEGRRGICRRFKSGGGSPGIRFAAAVDSIPAWRRRMRSLMILNEDGFGICERIEDAAGVVIYADPPYLEKSGSYVHDFADDDHERLASILGRFRRTRVVVSYYAHPRLSELYPGWTVVDCSMNKATARPGMKSSGPAVAPEVLLINGPAIGRASLFA